MQFIPLFISVDKLDTIYSYIMKTVKFKTNINCDGCIRSVSPYLNDIDNVESWKVDTEDPKKILQVDLEDNNDASVIDAVKKAGFEIETL